MRFSDARLFPVLAILSAAALPLFASGCLDRSEAAEPPKAQAPANPSDGAKVRLKTVEVAEAPMPSFLSLTGSLVASEESELAADTTGKVIATYVERGAIVKKGAPIVHVDTRNAELSAAAAEADLQVAEAQRELARNNCERGERLFKDKAIAQAEYDRIHAECVQKDWGIEAARTKKRIAQKSLQDAWVRAPFTGLIAERKVSVGEYLQPQTKVASLLAIDTLRVELTVPEASMAAIKEGMSVEFDVAAYPQETFRGVVRYLGPAVTRQSRAQIIEAVVENQDHRLHPGMFATARVTLAERPVPVVPLGAVKSDGVTRRVFVVQNGRLEERIVKLGVERNGIAAVEQGLTSGQRIAAEKSGELHDGLEVVAEN